MVPPRARLVLLGSLAPRQQWPRALLLRGLWAPQELAVAQRWATARSGRAPLVAGAVELESSGTREFLGAVATLRLGSRYARHGNPLPRAQVPD